MIHTHHQAAASWGRCFFLLDSFALPEGVILNEVKDLLLLWLIRETTGLTADPSLRSG
jgi:hypothetical protein